MIFKSHVFFQNALIEIHGILMLSDITYAHFMTRHPSHEKIDYRLKSLRTKLQQKQLNGFFIPHEDMFQGEYILSRDEWIYYFSNFKGSAGTLIVLEHDAALFVDGRYTLQAKRDVDESLITIQRLGDEEEWLKKQQDTYVSAPPTSIIIGLDPWTITSQRFQRLQGAPLRTSFLTWEFQEGFLDSLWLDRPPHPCAPLFHHALEYCGESPQEKIQNTLAIMKKNDVDGFLFGPESWHWLLNIRGGDLHYTPLSQGFLWLSQNVMRLFLCNQKVADSITFPELTPQIIIDEMHHLPTFLQEQSTFFSSKSSKPQTFGYDPMATPLAVVRLFHERLKIMDPSLLLRACKNPVEIKGSEKAHIKDAIAWMDFWYQLNHTIYEASMMPQNESITRYPLMSKGKPYTEYTVMEDIEKARNHTPTFHTLSFPTIAGGGQNGAIVHYHASKEHARPLFLGDILLLDSGGQYKEGTTDITRTLLLSPRQESDFEQSAEHTSLPYPWLPKNLHEICEAYTRVLKGHIALARIVFPKGTNGAQLDVLARQYLWSQTMDFAHGTGHGVGSFLSVHEGPQRISKMGTTPLCAGMILSNEPGYYKENDFGIRLENLMVAQNHPSPFESAGNWLRFSTLTLVPFDHQLIQWHLLDAHEYDWLSSYYDDIWSQLVTYLDYEHPKTQTPPDLLKSFIKERLCLEKHITKR